MAMVLLQEDVQGHMYLGSWQVVLVVVTYKQRKVGRGKS